MNSKGNEVWKLLKRNISAGQIAGYAAANLVGLAIVMTALQFYRDITAGWESEDTMVSSDYVVISKRIEGMGGLLGSPVGGFSDAEIDSIEAQPWSRRVGEFTSSRYNVQASVQLQGRGLATSMFFESIPDDFFDVSPAGWHFDPADPGEIPIVLSKDYLALYNFGFAATRGLPQLSESMISMVPLRVSISGNGRQMELPARIAGFSSRLNTIAVPQSFMDWANATFSTSGRGAPSRLIIEVNSPGDPAIADYLARHNWESAGDKLDNGKASYFLRLATGVVVGVGAVISGLSFFILMLSIYLLIHKNRRKIHDLMLLGYTPRQVARSYYRLAAIVNLTVFVAATAVTLSARNAWSAGIEALGGEPAPPTAALVTGLIIILAVTALNVWAIRRLTLRAFY